jgi:hypothetical protein
MRSASSAQPSPNSAVTGVASDLPLEKRAKILAEKCWNEDETFLKKDKIAEWLGGQ